MLGAIKYNLSHLGDFTGRDARQTFWFYVLFLVIAKFVISLIVTLPMTIGAMSGAMDAARSGNPEAVQGQMMQQMAEGMGTQIWIGAGLGVLMIALLTAAFVRRLHDAGFSGYWAVVPIVLELGFIAYSINNIGAVQEMMMSMQAAQTSNDVAEVQRLTMDSAKTSLLGWVATLIVVGFGVLPSKPEANQYGDEPVRF